MARILFDHVSLVYPIRHNKGLSLKEFTLKWFRREEVKLIENIPALTKVSFSFREGERIGIIGLNGAGKSTLLRTIAGVYPATEGRRVVEGSVSSLFDIFLGFETEATGYDNIWYRLYLQGETPRTIPALVKPIADFCELGDFLNVPVRCYSSGMVMRLAFSIATSLNPEILLIDEVFAVGDVQFMQKAQNRMENFMNKAKIVVMVGHNLEFLRQFCTRIIWLNKGQVHMAGGPDKVIAAFNEAATRKTLAA